MPQLQNLILTDRATPTPIAHTFTPDSPVANGGVLAEGNGTKIGENRFTISSRRSAGQGKYIVELLLNIPTVATETINGVDSPKVIRRAIVGVKFELDAASTEQERKNLVGMLQSAFEPGKALVNDSVVKLEGIRS